MCECSQPELHRVLMGENTHTHTLRLFPVSNKAAEQRSRQRFDHGRWMCPDPLSPPSPVSRLLSSCPPQVQPPPPPSFTVFSQIRCLRDNLEPGRTTSGACFYPGGGFLSTTREQRRHLGGGGGDSPGLEFSCPRISTSESQLVAAGRR